MARTFADTHTHTHSSPRCTEVEQSVAKVINRRRTFLSLTLFLLSHSVSCTPFVSMRKDEKCVSCCNITRNHYVFIIFTPLVQCRVRAAHLMQAGTGVCVFVYLSFYHPICWQLVERKRLHAPHGPSTTTRRKNTIRHKTKTYNNPTKKKKNIYSIKSTVTSNRATEERESERGS